MGKFKENYVRVRCILIVRTKDAIAIDAAPFGSPEIDKQWIPMSLIHGADEPKLGNDHSTDIVEFRLVSWKAAELGLD